MVLKPNEIPQKKESPFASAPDLPPPFKNSTDSKPEIDKLEGSANGTNDASLNEEESLTDDANLTDDTNSEELSLTRTANKSEKNSEELSLNRVASKSESSLNDCSFSFDLESEAPSPTEQADCAKVLLFLQSPSPNIPNSMSSVVIKTLRYGFSLYYGVDLWISIRRVP